MVDFMFFAAAGLAGALALLKERGDLAERIEWSGRINDMRRERMGDLTDVYTDGRHDERIASDIERALTERDEFGRILTPRERFRRLCYRHAQRPSPPNARLYLWLEGWGDQSCKATVQCLYVILRVIAVH